MPQTDRQAIDAFVRPIRPYADVVIVEVEPDSFVAGSGLLIGHANIEQSPVRKGRVLKVGPGQAGKRGGRIASPYAVGDRVCFARGEGYIKTTVGGAELRFLKEEQLEGFVIDGEGHFEARFVD